VQLEAWTVFSNHYHFVAVRRGRGRKHELSKMLTVLHQHTPSGSIGSTKRRPQNWHNFWDTKLTIRIILARLNYVHQNPVEHGLVRLRTVPLCRRRV